ncbi:Peroxisomal membrane protein PMP22 [Apiospora kogelbergensis]|uniref:Peroxisomal membrane protein PMP22 n=1 Tax=Apiospora kogelbergensis TaxID=1337665 RepID=UPI00313038E2
MSLKIERNTVRQNTGSVVDAARQTVHDAAHDVRDVAREIVKGPADGPLPGTSGKHPIAESIGTAITGGKKAAGSNGYMMAYINQLEKNPLRTKMLTAGTLASLQELIASFLAKDRNKHGNYFTSRVPKMAAYGALVSAPLGHFLIWCLQKAFKGRTSLRSKIMQIIVSNLVIAPIQNSIYLIAMALIAGARTYHQVRATVRVGFMKVMKVTWVTSPLCLAFAQQFLPGVHKKRLAALRKKHFGDDRSDRGDGRGLGRGDGRDGRDVRGDGRPGTMGGRPEDYPGPMGPNPPTKRNTQQTANDVNAPWMKKLLWREMYRVELVVCE